MNDTATFAKSKTRPAAPTAATEQAYAKTAIAVAFGEIGSALLAAARTDEARNESGDSNRLLRVAGNLADAAQFHPAASGAEYLAFDIAALVKAALLVPSDVPSAERKACIEEARPHLVQLTDCLDVLEPVAPAQAAQDGSPKRDPLDSYSIEQIRTVFEVIAGRANTLHHLLMMASAGTYEGEVGLDAGLIVATEIGVMADSVLGGAIIGDRDHWIFGPNFTATAKAVQA